MDSPERKTPSQSDLSFPDKLVQEAIEHAYSATGHQAQTNSDGGAHRSGIVKALDIAQIAPYGLYYATYEAGKAVNYLGSRFGPVGSIVSHTLAATLAPSEALGLGVNEALGVGILAADHGHGNLYEGYKGNLLPKFIDPSAPKVYFPGIHKDGKIDFAW
jgi:hypothetical protein